MSDDTLPQEQRMRVALDDGELVFLRTKLKNGEYNGVDIMHAWLAIDELRSLRAELADTITSIPQMIRDERSNVRAEVLRELLEWEAEYMQQATGGDNSGRSDARASAAREIHDHLRHSWDTRDRRTQTRPLRWQERSDD